jgi:hypothetical protein
VQHAGGALLLQARAQLGVRHARQQRGQRLAAGGRHGLKVEQLPVVA